MTAARGRPTPPLPVIVARGIAQGLAIAEWLALTALRVSDHGPMPPRSSPASIDDRAAIIEDFLLGAWHAERDAYFNMECRRCGVSRRAHRPGAPGCAGFIDRLNVGGSGRS